MPGPRLITCLVCLLAFVAAVPAQQFPSPPPAVDPEGRDDDGVVVVTASRRDEHGLDVPQSITVIEGDALHHGPTPRNLADTLTREPGVLLQKTGPGQSSPFIRGFTGFRTLWLVDGVRLNNSVWRDGPNQYAGTVDLFSVHRLELVRGPAAVTWGSDAVGGTLNALTAAPRSEGWGGAYEVRWSSAERSLVNRLEVEGGQEGSFAVRAGITDKNMGNIESGDGNLPGTNYDERDADVRLDVPLGENAELTLVAQRVRQADVPRTHKTVDSVPFHGTSPGTELYRDLDQDRDLVYARLGWEDSTALYDGGSVTLSYQRQSETQDRLRTGGRFDTRGFDVDTLGAQFQLEKDSSVGWLTYGVEAWRDDVDSFRRDFVDGVAQAPQIQGPVGDDARYSLLGVFAQSEITHGDHETTVGVRWTRASADANRVDNPNVAGGDPGTPGNVISVDESWSELTGSLRTLRHLDDQTSLYASVSQGFRAPNLSDLTSDLEDSGVEQPTPDLEPEHFVAFEVGAKTDQDGWHGDVALFYTRIRDQIVRSPTGEVDDGVPVFRKDNVGDGYVSGVEARGEVALDEDWSAFGVATWFKGRIDQFRPDGSETRGPISRHMPATARVGVAYEPPGEIYRVEADVLMADEADELSLRDESDTERIPPGGTPGWAILGVRSTLEIDARRTLGVAVENIFDKDFRIHGSGQNEPGRSLVVSYRMRF